MARKFLRKIRTANLELSQVQDNVTNALNPVLNAAIVYGVIIKSVQLSTTALRLQHTLDEIPTGYIVIGRNAAATVYDSARDSKTITLTATATVTVDLLIF